LIGRNDDLIEEVLGELDEGVFWPFSDLMLQGFEVVTDAG
jgi:hypothetical protein